MNRKPVRLVILSLGVLLLGATLFSVSASGQSAFVRGRCNADVNIDITDPIFLLAYLFSAGSSPTCLDACDVNDDEALNIADPIYLLSYLFTSGSPPPPPNGPLCNTIGEPAPQPGELGCGSCGGAPPNPSSHMFKVANSPISIPSNSTQVVSIAFEVDTTNVAAWTFSVQLSTPGIFTIPSAPVLGADLIASNIDFFDPGVDSASGWVSVSTIMSFTGSSFLVPSTVDYMILDITYATSSTSGSSNLNFTGFPVPIAVSDENGVASTAPTLAGVLSTP